jgi:hypothetical protein
MDSHPTGEGGVTLPSLYLYVFPCLADNYASTFIGPSLHLHTSLRCLEMPKLLGRLGESW